MKITDSTLNAADYYYFHPYPANRHTSATAEPNENI